MSYRCINRECDGHTPEEDSECTSCLAEAAYWKRYYGQDDPDPRVRREILEAMRPLSRGDGQ